MAEDFPSREERRALAARFVSQAGQHARRAAQMRDAGELRLAQQQGMPPDLGRRLAFGPRGVPPVTLEPATRAALMYVMEEMVRRTGMRMEELGIACRQAAEQMGGLHLALMEALEASSVE